MPIQILAIMTMLTLLPAMLYASKRKLNMTTGYLSRVARPWVAAGGRRRCPCRGSESTRSLCRSCSTTPLGRLSTAMPWRCPSATETLPRKLGLAVERRCSGLMSETKGVPACEIADVHVALWNAIEAGDDARARAIFTALLPLLDMESNYGMPLMKEVLRQRGVIASSAVRQSGFRPLDDAARAEAMAIMDGLADLMLPQYAHRR